MKNSALRPRLAALVTACIACFCLLSLSSGIAWARVGSIKEFPVPTPNSDTVGITLGPDGNLWFTEFLGNKIGRITPKGTITEFPLPTTCGGPPGCTPAGITVGPDGNLWFPEGNGNKIGRITTSGAITEFPIPTPGSDPVGITAGPARTSNLWFTETIGNKIGRISN